MVLQMWAELMKEPADNLRELLLQTLIVHHQCLFTAVHQFSNGMHKYYDFSLQQRESDRRHHEAVEPIRSVENYFSLIDISAIGHDKLVCVNVELERSDPYQPRCFSSHPSIPNYRYYRWDGLETWHLVSLLHRKFGEALGPLEQPLPASTSVLLILTSCPACSVEEFRQQDTREHPYLQANPNWRRVYRLTRETRSRWLLGTRQSIGNYCLHMML